MQGISSPHSSWHEILSTPAAGSHLVQFYEETDFLLHAVTHYAAEGLRRGEAVLLNGTPASTRAIVSQLKRQGVDADAAVHSGQLTPFDVKDGLGANGAHGGIDGPVLASALRDASLKALQGGRFTGVRWWGELVNLLHHRGELDAAMEVERVAGEAARSIGSPIFCSFLADRFDAGGYDALHRMCCAHTHAIPARDYVSHRLAVNRAIAEVVGELRGSLLQSLSIWRGPGCDQPSSQALLFWLRETLPEHFDAVLARARAYHTSTDP